MAIGWILENGDSEMPKTCVGIDGTNRNRSGASLRNWRPGVPRRSIAGGVLGVPDNASATYSSLSVNRTRCVKHVFLL